MLRRTIRPLSEHQLDYSWFHSRAEQSPNFCFSSWSARWREGNSMRICCFYSVPVNFSFETNVSELG